MNRDILKYLENIVSKENIQVDEEMSKHTTFRTGGCVSAFVQVKSEEQLQRILKFLHKMEEPYYVLGNGSNLLVSDEGFEGIMIQIGSKMSEIQVFNETMYVQAGASLIRVAKEAYEHGLTGLEFASGIPGTIGGATVMNAGAYGGEMKQIIKKVRIMSQEGEILELDNASMEFDYRSSAILNRNFIVLDVELMLNPGNKEKIYETMQELSKKRREKQPLEYPSAGSTFKRPEGNYAGKLIMDAGLRGYRVGDACVSEKHCGFVINTGHATSKDIWKLIYEVQKKVYETSGVRLETEVIPIGTFQKYID